MPPKKDKTKQKQKQKQSQSVTVNVAYTQPKKRRERQPAPSSNKSQQQPAIFQAIPYLGLQSANNAQLLNSIQANFAALYSQHNRQIAAAPPLPNGFAAPPRLITPPPLPPTTPAPPTTARAMIPTTSTAISVVGQQAQPATPFKPLQRPPRRIEASKGVTIRSPETVAAPPSQTPKTEDSQSLSSLSSLSSSSTAKTITGRVVAPMSPTTGKALGYTYTSTGKIHKGGAKFKSLSFEERQNLLDAEALYQRNKARENPSTHGKVTQTPAKKESHIESRAEAKEDTKDDRVAQAMAEHKLHSTTKLPTTSEVKKTTEMDKAVGINRNLADNFDDEPVYIDIVPRKKVTNYDSDAPVSTKSKLKPKSQKVPKTPTAVVVDGNETDYGPIVEDKEFE